MTREEDRTDLSACVSQAGRAALLSLLEAQAQNWEVVVGVPHSLGVGTIKKK